MQNLKLLAIAIIAFIIGFFGCKNFSGPKDDVVDAPVYKPINEIYTDYAKNFNRADDFAGVEITKSDILEIASDPNLPDGIQMILGIDNARKKVVYFKGVYGAGQKPATDSIFYIANNGLQKISPLQLATSFYAESNTTLQNIFETVFVTASAARLPKCPPYTDPRCNAVQAARVEGVNSSDDINAIN